MMLVKVLFQIEYMFILNVSIVSYMFAIHYAAQNARALVIPQVDATPKMWYVLDVVVLIQEIAVPLK
jgi:hypothetical protein